MSKSNCGSEKSGKEEHKSENNCEKKKNWQRSNKCFASLSFISKSDLTEFERKKTVILRKISFFYLDRFDSAKQHGTHFVFRTTYLFFFFSTFVEKTSKSQPSKVYS